METNIKKLIVEALNKPSQVITENDDNVSGDLDFSPLLVRKSKDKEGNHKITIDNTDSQGEKTVLHISPEGKLVNHKLADSDMYKYSAKKTDAGVLVKGKFDFDGEVHHHNILIHDNGKISRHIHDGMSETSMTITPKGEDHEKIKKLLS